MDAYGAIAGHAIGALPDEAFAALRPLRARLIAGEEVETVIIAEITSRSVAPTGPLPDIAEPIAALAIGDAPNLLAGAGPEDVLFVADGQWCGRPDDFGAAHLEPKILLVDFGEQTTEIPYLPEQDRRATTSSGTMTLANGDGALDAFFGSRTVDGHRVRAFLTDDRDGYSAHWVEIADLVTEALDPEIDEARLIPINVAAYLETPALRSKYEGRGGSTGDARLKDKFVPLAFGDCFNVEPDNESFENGIDRWHDGALVDVTAVRDGGAPLLWDGLDYPDYSTLKNAVVAPGFFTKALAIGRTKRGAEALFRITGDISAPLQTTAEILLALARGAAGLSEDLVDAPSFGALPIAPVNLFIKGDRQVTAAEIFDALLRPFNGWYGSMGSRKLAVGIAAAPETLVETWAVDSHEVEADSFRDRKFETQVRWRVGVTGARNWTPMGADELVDYVENPSLPREMWERLQREEELAERADAALKLRHRLALDAVEEFGATRGYFTNLADAQAAADALFALLSRPMRRVEFDTGLQELFTQPGTAGRVALEGRLEIDAGKPALVTRRVFRGSRRIGFSTLVVVDGEAA